MDDRECYMCKRWNENVDCLMSVRPNYALALWYEHGDRVDRTLPSRGLRQRKRQLDHWSGDPHEKVIMHCLGFRAFYRCKSPYVSNSSQCTFTMALSTPLFETVRPYNSVWRILPLTDLFMTISKSLLQIHFQYSFYSQNF